MQKLPSALLSGGFLFLVLAVVFGWMIGPLIIEDQITQKTQLYNGSYAWKKWKDPSNFFLLNLYLFNVTNPAQVLRGQIPIFEQVGPYVYEERRYRTDVKVDLENDTVQFRMPVWYFFRPDLSNGTEDDLVTMINIPLIAVSQQLADFPTMIRFLIGTYLKKFKEAVFVSRTVAEMLFKGYYSGMIEELQSLTGDNIIPNNTFGILYGKNGSDDGTIVSKTGIADSSEFGLYVSWNGKTETDYWPGEKCNRIQGTDGAIFAPFITKKTILRSFQPDVCRSVYATYAKDVVVKGIPGYRFEAPQYFYESVYLNPDNECFCLNPGENFTGCYEKGVQTLSVCKHGAPLTVSNPHFLYAPYYLSLTEGLNPQKELHETFIEVEPNTGVGLRGAKRAQLNVELKPVSGIDGLRKVPKMQFPVMWAEETAVVDDETYGRLKSEFHIPLQIFKATRWITLGLSCSLIGTAVSIFFMRARKKNYHT